MRTIALLLAFSSLAMAAAQADSGVPADAVVATLPFLAADEPNRIFVDLAPEGRAPFRMMLDTGASFSVFTPLAARAAGVSVRALKSTPYRHSTRLGRDLLFQVDTRSSDTGARSGWEYGLLGANFLENYVLELDFSGRTVRFLDPEKYAVPEQTTDADAAIVPMKLTSGRPLIEIGVDGGPIEVMLDTGCDVTAVLSGSAARSAGIDVDALADFGAFYTVLGKTSARFYEASEVAIAGKRFAAVPVIVSPKGWFNQVGSSNSAIGYDLISRFLVRIDYPRKRIWLRRTSERITYLGVDYPATREAGVLLVASGNGYSVMRVAADTSAAKLGIVAGDWLPMESAGSADRKTLEEILAAIRAGKPVRVARQINDVWIDVDLPDDPLLNSDATTPEDDGE